MCSARSCTSCDSVSGAGRWRHQATDRRCKLGPRLASTDSSSADCSSREKDRLRRAVASATCMRPRQQGWWSPLAVAQAVRR